MGNKQTNKNTENQWNKNLMSLEEQNSQDSSQTDQKNSYMTLCKLPILKMWGVILL